MRRSRLIIGVVALAVILLLSATAIMAQTSPTGCTTPVTVWDNDTLYTIAARYNVDVNVLAAANALTPGSRLQIGQVLCLDGVAAKSTPATTPGTGGPTATPTAMPGTPTPPATATAIPPSAVRALGFIRGQNPTPPAGWQIYVVQPNDTLFSISQRYNVAMQALMVANNIVNPSIIYRGESLLIPAGGTGGTIPTVMPGTPTATPMPGTPTATASPPPTGFIPTPPAGVGTIPQISLQPVRAAPGDTVTVIGSNYPPGMPVDLYIEKPSLGLKSGKLATTSAGADGRFTYSLTIPETWNGTVPVQTNTISIAGYAPGGYWGMNYVVNPEAITGAPGPGTGATPMPGSTPIAGGATPIPTPPAGQNTIPAVMINPRTAAPGDTITVTGTNFPPNVPVDVYLEKPTYNLKSGVLATLTTGADGTFTHTMTVPATWNGTRPVSEYIVSVSAYAPGGYWGMNYFVNP